MEVAVDAYVASRMRLVALVQPRSASMAVPACPGWVVSDVIGHLVGMAEDVVADDVDGFATEAWTAAHVTRTTGRELPELLARWAAIEAEVLRALRDPRSEQRVFAPLSVLVAFDTMTHEQDIRTAIGAPPFPAGPELALVAEISTNGLRATHAALSAVEVEATDTGQRWTIGRQPASASVRASAFELWRSLSGRRTVDEVRAYEWDGDADDHVDAWLMPIFRWPQEPVGL